MSTGSIRAGLDDGSSLRDARAAAARIKADLRQSVSRISSLALGAGRSLGKAVRASRQADQQRQRGQAAGGAAVRRTMNARDAFHQRVSAEAEKNRAVYLALASDARGSVLRSVQLATNTRDARQKQVLIERAGRDGAKADVLEEAARRTMAAVRDIPEPEAVSMRKAQRIAVASGTPMDNRTPEASLMPFPVMNTKMVSPLMTGFFPDDVVRAASSLQGLGEVVQTETSFMDSVKAALGVGVSAAGSAALAAGQAAARDNPAAGAAAGAAGGLLSSLAATLGIQMNTGFQQGQQQQRQDTVAATAEEFPWGLAFGALVVVGGGYALWRASR